jgi:hypothetical protein
LEEEVVVEQETDRSKDKGRGKIAPKASHPLREFEEAYEAYFRELEEAWNEAHRHFCEALESRLHEERAVWTQPDARAQLHDLAKKHLTEIDSTSVTARKRYEQAYFTYLSAIQRAWAGVDPSRLDIWAVLAVSRSVLCAGACAAHLLGSLRIVRDRPEASAT